MKRRVRRVLRRGDTIRADGLLWTVVWATPERFHAHVEYQGKVVHTWTGNPRWVRVVRRSDEGALPLPLPTIPYAAGRCERCPPWMV